MKFTGFFILKKKRFDKTQRITDQTGGFGEDREERKEEEKEDFHIISLCFSPQTDAKADGGELAENGQKKK